MEHQLILVPTLNTNKTVAAHLSLRSKERMSRERAWARERKRRRGVGHSKGGGKDEKICDLLKGRVRIF